MQWQGDVAIIGSGFGGSLTALVLGRIGLRCALVDRKRHPRFAIGESSTPVADLVLRDLTREYNLPRIAPLAKYGTWRASYPEVVCGRKRGFSYFHQQCGQPFRPATAHDNELLVAASSSDELSDTHWLRADVDQLLAREAEREGTLLLEQAALEVTDRRPWRLAGQYEGQPVQLTADLLVDASGEAGFVSRALGIPDDSKQLRTNSRALYGHFVRVRPWHDLLREAGGTVQDHPFYCDHAALHHLLSEGWMWQLGFDNGVTSAGFALDNAAVPLDERLSPDEEWERYLQRYPSLADQFTGSLRVAPQDGLRRTKRMQRLASQITGEDWVMLPNTAGFIDPLHSSGIAHTLCGVERLARTIRNFGATPHGAQDLARYAVRVRSELLAIDRLVALGYQSRHDFPLFCTAAMLYFVAATTYERRRLAGEQRLCQTFLCTEDRGLWDAIELAAGAIERELQRPAEQREPSRLQQDVARAIADYNTAGLCDPSVENMYRYTALPE